MDFNIKKKGKFIYHIKQTKCRKKKEKRIAKREIYRFQGKTSALNITNKIFQHYF